jgi:hypothetical protein
MVLHAGSCSKPVYCYIQAASEGLVLHLKTAAAGLYSAAYKQLQQTCIVLHIGSPVVDLHWAAYSHL